jgi:hypothetical protein
MFSLCGKYINFIVSYYIPHSGIPRNFFFLGREGVQQIQLMIEGRENGDLRATVPLNLQMSKTCILNRLL